MKIVNCKLKIISVAAVLFLVVVPVVFVVFTSSFVQAANCGLATDNPATPENETASCGSLVPCTGVDCTICDFFKLFQNIFNKALVLVPVVAVGFICWAGYCFLIAGGKPDQITKAKGILKSTFIGIAIFYSSYAIASSVLGIIAKSTNPAIDFGFHGSSFTFSCPEGTGGIDVFYSGGTITVNIPGVDQYFIPPNEEFEGATTTQAIKEGGVRVFRNGGVNMAGVNADVKTQLNSASALLADDYHLLVTSGKREYNTQVALVNKNCKPGATSSSADCEPDTCIPSGGTGYNCRHITGKALDVHLANAEGKNIENQAELVRVMRAAGFCRYRPENWHFELKSQIEASRMGSFTDCP
jgi:hypothetical protein